MELKGFIPLSGCSASFLAEQTTLVADDTEEQTRVVMVRGEHLDINIRPMRSWTVPMTGL